MLAGIPLGIGGFQVHLARVRMNVGVVHVRRERDLGVQIAVVVLRIALESEFEDAVGKGTTANEDDSMEEADVVERGDEVNSWKVRS
jgi:hypothetical protein